MSKTWPLVGVDKKIENEVGAVQGERALHVQEVILAAGPIEVDHPSRHQADDAEIDDAGACPAEESIGQEYSQTLSTRAESIHPSPSVRRPQR